MRLTFAALSLAFLVSPVVAEEPGNLWEVTTSMEGGGMKMPGQTQQVCAPVNAEGPEAMAAGDDRCQMTDVRRSPGRFSYQVQCPDGSGTGEMTYQGTDSWTQVMTMTMDGETMKMASAGKRIGSCDASKVKKQIAAVQAQAAVLHGADEDLDGDAGLQRVLAERVGGTPGGGGSDGHHGVVALATRCDAA